PRRVAAALRFRALHLGSGRHLVRAQALHGVLHVRHGEGLRAALPLRPAHAAGLEGVPAAVYVHGGGHGSLPEILGAVGRMSIALIGALVGLAVAVADLFLLRLLAS